MSGYQLTELALADVDDILQYSISNWGDKVVNRYYWELHDCFNWLVKNAQSGKNRSEIDIDVYSYRYKSHLIFYEIQPQTLVILRILHQRRDFPRHLT